MRKLHWKKMEGSQIKVNNWLLIEFLAAVLWFSSCLLALLLLRA
jgi:hypothetical protein